MQPLILHSKFNPFILSPHCLDDEKKELHQKLEQIFKKASLSDPLSPIDHFTMVSRNKEHIAEHPQLNGWIIKGQKNELVTTPDTHIYRVRRAERLRSLKLKEFVIPKKYLYQHNNKWYVIAEKLELKHDSFFVLNAAQTKECVRLIYEGKMIDLHSNNIVRTVDDKLALIDTEPLLRAPHKRIKTFYRFWPLYMSTARFICASHEAEQLKRRTSKNVPADLLIHIQNTMFMKHLAKLVALVALPIFTTIGLAYSDILPSSVLKVTTIATIINGFLGLFLISYISKSDYDTAVYAIYM